MPDNLSVNVTADATQLRAKLALAAADLKTYGAAVRATAAEIRSSGVAATAEQTAALDKNAAAYNTARAAVNGLRTSLGEGANAARAAAQSMEQVNTSAGHAAHGSAGVTREFIVLGHEVLQGNFSRIPGSMMVLAERSGGLLSAISAMSGGMWVGVGAAAALAVALVELALKAHQTEAAMRGVYDAALLQGRGAAAAETAARAWTAEMTVAGNLGTAAAVRLASAIGTIPGLSDAARNKLAALGPALAQVLHDGDATEAAKSIDQIFRSTSAIKAFADENHLLTVAQQNAFEAALRSKDAYTAQGIALDALQARIGPAYAAFAKGRSDAATALAGQVASAMSITPNYTQPEALTAIAPLRMSQTGTRAESEETRRGNAVQEEYLTTQRERQKLTADMIILQGNLARAATEEARAETAAAIKSNQAKQDMLRDPGGAGHMAEWNATLAARLAYVAANAKDVKGIELAEARTKVQFWDDASKQQGITDAERTQALANANKDRAALFLLEARQGEASGKQALEARLAELSAQQSAYHDNFTVVLQLEQQKLDLLLAAGATYTKQYQDELRRREDMIRAHNLQLIGQDLEHLSRVQEQDRQALAERRATLDAEVSDHLITKQEELADLRAFAQQQHDIERQALDDLIATLTEGTAEYRKAMDQRAVLEATHGKSMAALGAQTAQADRQDRDRTFREYEQMFAGIGQAANTSTLGLIKGTTTWQQAEVNVASAVVESFAIASEKMLANWAARLVAQQIDNAAANAVIAAQNAGMGTGWETLVQRMLAQFTGAKSAEVTANAIANAAKTGNDVAGATAGSGAAIVTASKAAISGDAAKAAAATYANVAQIPYVGWILAPVAAGVAFAAVAAYEGMVPSFAVGAYDLSHDTLAQVHKGEMIIPADVAAGMRAGGMGGDTHLHYSPTISGAPGSLHGAVAAQGADFKSWITDMARNGNLRLPGR